MGFNQGFDKKQDLKTQKKELREKLLSLKRSLENKEELDRKISQILINTLAYKYSDQILFYASREEEISTWDVTKKALEDGKKVLFPKCFSEHRMSFYYIEDLNDLESGMFQIKEPVGNKLYVPQNNDICIVPAVVYDRLGYRLGYGKGYYDRFLSDFSGVKIGLCYSELVSKELPRNIYDVRVDILLTEKGVYPLVKK